MYYLNKVYLFLPRNKTSAQFHLITSPNNNRNREIEV